jgi:dTMP kinase
MGQLIILEGVDGAGTTTQIKLLADYLLKEGFKVAQSAEPTDSALGREIRSWLKKPLENEPYLLTMLALSFAADRMQHVHFTLDPKLKTHDFVLVDRYIMSSLVYQGLDLPETFIREINKYAFKPDLTIVLDISAELAFKRIKERFGDKDFYESLPLLKKICDRYRHFANIESHASVLVDASSSVDHVHNHIVAVIREKYENLYQTR